VAQNLFQGSLALGQGGSALAAQAGGLTANAYQQQQQNALAALAQQSQIAQQGIAGQLAGTQNLAAAQQLPLQALQAQNQYGAAPYNAAFAQQQNAQQALQQQLQMGNALYGLPEDVQNEIQSYLNLGQSASRLGGQLATQNLQNTNTQLQGIGNLLGGANSLLGGGGGGGVGNLVFGQGGLSGALGLGNQGLLGSLPGSAGFSTATDFAGGEAGAGSGLLGWLGNLFAAAPALAA
jgi:hypothetical protein